MKLGQKNYSGAQYFIPRSSDRIVTHLNMKYVKAALEWDGRPDKSVTLDTVKNDRRQRQIYIGRFVRLVARFVLAFQIQRRDVL